MGPSLVVLSMPSAERGLSAEKSGRNDRIQRCGKMRRTFHVYENKGSRQGVLQNDPVRLLKKKGNDWPCGKLILSGY
jgi:hypothetical protein